MNRRGTIADVLAGAAEWSLSAGDVLAPDALPALPDKSIAHTFADPPYEAEAHEKGRRRERSTGGVMVERPISYDAITDDQRTAVAAQIHRVTRGWSLTWCQAEAIHLWRAAYEAAGGRYVRAGTYWKADGQPQISGDRPGQGWESAVICWHGGGAMSWNGGGKCARWRSIRDPGKNLVDGQKPLSVLMEIVADFSDPGDVILSPYCGAGTEILAAVALGRRGITWELSPKHYAIAESRLVAGEKRPIQGQSSLWGAL